MFLGLTASVSKYDGLRLSGSIQSPTVYKDLIQIPDISVSEFFGSKSHRSGIDNCFGYNYRIDFSVRVFLDLNLITALPVM